jgi:hypothetical protein
VQPEGLGQFKKSTSSGLEPAGSKWIGELFKFSKKEKRNGSDYSGSLVPSLNLFKRRI